MVRVAHTLDDSTLGILMTRWTFLAKLCVIVGRTKVRAQMFEKAHFSQWSAARCKQMSWCFSICK
jgi:hypothetical protein